MKKLTTSLSLTLSILASLGCADVTKNNTEYTKENAVQQTINTATKKPNIVLFFVDDMGWASRSSKNSNYETPNIEKLAGDGVDFNSMYIPTPTCSPSRATLVTGQHPARINMVRHIPHKARYGFDEYGRTEQRLHYWEKDPAKVPSVNWLDTEYTTYAEALKEQGYYNMFVGKWHLGHEGYLPTDQGFDQQRGTTNWGHPKSYNAPFFKNSDVYKDVKEGYLTDKLTDDAVDFIEEFDQEKPFMLSMWYYGIHSPLQGRKDLYEHYKQKGLSNKEAHHAALVGGVDESIGRIRQALADKNIDKDTIVIFLSDQGGLLDNAPLHGGKKSDTLFEGGARVPFIISWPGVTQAGETNYSVVQSTDLFPTLIEISGGNVEKYKNLDGVSLVDTIKNNSKLSRNEPIYGYRAYEDLYASVREGDWKLLAYRSGTLKLFNIVNDMSEQNDLASKNPRIVTKLKAKLVNWEKEMEVEQYSGVQ